MFQPGLMKGQKILVTGGGTGLGRAMSEKFLSLGAEVAICGRRKQVCEDTASELMKAHGGKVSAYGVDIRDAAAVDAMVGEIFKAGPLTGLVNNAAGNFISRTEDLSPNGFDAVANIVMRGTFYVTHAVGKRWIAGKHKGNVVSISVTWVRNGGPFVVPDTPGALGPIATGYSVPLDTYSDMSQLLPAESWPGPQPLSVAYFCGVMADDAAPNDDRLATAGSFSTSSASAFWRCAIAS